MGPWSVNIFIAVISEVYLGQLPLVAERWDAEVSRLEALLREAKQETEARRLAAEADHNDLARQLAMAKLEAVERLAARDAARTPAFAKGGGGGDDAEDVAALRAALATEKKLGATARSSPRRHSAAFEMDFFPELIFLSRKNVLC